MRTSASPESPRGKAATRSQEQSRAVAPTTGKRAIITVKYAFRSLDTGPNRGRILAYSPTGDGIFVSEASTPERP